MTTVNNIGWLVGLVQGIVSRSGAKPEGDGRGRRATPRYVVRAHSASIVALLRMVRPNDEAARRKVTDGSAVRSVPAVSLHSRAVASFNGVTRDETGKYLLTLALAAIS